MKKQALLPLPPGTYAKIADALDYSESYVAMVARGQRRNAVIELQLQQESLNYQRLQQRIRRFKRITKHGKNS